MDWSGDSAADLVRVSGEAARAQGAVTHLRGRVLDARGEPVHVAATTPGRAPLVTQFYLIIEPRNERDKLFNALRDPRQREALFLRRKSADRLKSGALLASRDIVLG
ncbi:hypothetical protein [Belnapia rosea]|uniref:hypothetical protein n=1 Tax=Belnapia rosea TaxID=938405 RepID=UPI001C40A101|nr:hypothetical protein [Belnapia rosea]